MITQRWQIAQRAPRGRKKIPTLWFMYQQMSCFDKWHNNGMARATPGYIPCKKNAPIPYSDKQQQMTNGASITNKKVMD
jgi:hypothetical protein